jgi:hypothetical protein
MFARLTKSTNGTKIKKYVKYYSLVSAEQHATNSRKLHRAGDKMGEFENSDPLFLG